MVLYTTASATNALPAPAPPFSAFAVGLKLVRSVLSDRPSAKATLNDASPTLTALLAITFCTSVDSAVIAKEPAGPVSVPLNGSCVYWSTPPVAITTPLAGAAKV